jgi:beta-galactosidase
MVHDALPGVLPVINFGPGKAEGSYATRFLAMLYLASTMRSFRFEQPWMTGEYWAGWYDTWGGQHARTDAELQAKELDWMLDQGYSVNLYMFHRGTSFGFRNGANYGDMGYLPLVTSYDYDAALDEARRPTRKFYLFRDGIHRRTGITPPALPAPLPLTCWSRLLAAFIMGRGCRMGRRALPGPCRLRDASCQAGRWIPFR